MEDQMIEHSRQALVGTIGGTYITLAIADIDELSFANFALLNTADFSQPMQAVERYLKSLPRCPNKVGLAVAGTVIGDRAELKHRKWTITKNDVRATTAANSVHMINDFDALALSLPSLSSYELIPINTGEAVLHGNKVVIYSGTGLGVAGLVHDGERWLPVRGQAGATAFPAPAKGEFDIRKAFPPDHFVSMDDVFSGKGLVALYKALAGDKAPTLTARKITEAGLAKEDPAAEEALRLVATWLGRFAGDMALVFGAEGGVYLAGGFAANIVPALTTGHFREAFEGKGAFDTYLHKVAVNVIKTGADAAMRGAAIALAQSLPARPAVRRIAR
jgi:glucokinase